MNIRILHFKCWSKCNFYVSNRFKCHFPPHFKWLYFSVDLVEAKILAGHFVWRSRSLSSDIFQISSDMSDVTDGFREAWISQPTDVNILYDHYLGFGIRAPNGRAKNWLKHAISMRKTLLNDPLHDTFLKVIITCDRDGRLRTSTFISSRNSENFDRWTTSVGQVVPEIPPPPPAHFLVGFALISLTT